MSTYKEGEFIKVIGVFLPTLLKEIKKHENPIQSFFEAFTNSLESIKINKKDRGIQEVNSTISLNMYFKKNILAENEFEKFSIEDDGIGFNDEQFRRFTTLKDDRKGFENKGSGRIQYIHCFGKCEFKSVFKENEKYYERSFTISKSPAYIDKDSVIKHNYTKEVEAEKSSTILILSDLLNEEDIKKTTISISNLKIEILKRYLKYFCSHRENLPKIILNEYIDEKFSKSLEITKNEIPVPDKVEPFKVHYSTVVADNSEITTLDESENFELLSFKLKKSDLDKNSIFLVSKEEIVDNKDFKLKFKSLSPDDSLENMRYLVLVSSDYLNSKDCDTRGDLSILKRENFRKNDLFNLGKKEILFEDIEDRVDEVIDRIYPEIGTKKIEKLNKIDEIRKLFLFNDEVLQNLSISLNDTEDKIIQKLHVAESKISAKRDTEIFNQMNNLKNLNPADKSFEKNLTSTIEKLTKEIPIQNRTALTHYVARRKIILELFEKVIDRKLIIQNDGSRNNDEQLLHNIIFQQSANNPKSSDLWIINEDFIYFKGTSECLIKDIEINGEKIIKDTLTPEEESYITSLEENRLLKRTDILLFPDERKCIIIELKNPDVNVSEHLNQINRYASILRNLTKEEFSFDTFYGYLIGEKIDAEDIRDFDSDFKNAYHFDYVFRPKKDIVGKNGRTDGSLYTEVIKYSTLLKRAKKRNEIFIDKLKIDDAFKLLDDSDPDYLPF
ncbi:hypothetical protein Flavo103_10900 [Flavobacterium collinsii]|uniref:hypothetical protein n=1 Tax=Flavobacterium collinsii TaxID=1114861 RepID=UPI0022BC4316|nr:hypothetical protein [Flavobacterium collinsii]GIQ57954.1 hypothetical protein Flavo103_10900 [Flavobacterium collinsii]